MLTFSCAIQTSDAAHRVRIFVNPDIHGADPLTFSAPVATAINLELDFAYWIEKG